MFIAASAVLGCAAHRADAESGPAPGASAARDRAEANEPTDVSPILDGATAQRFARLALACIHRPYPNKIAHVMDSDEDVATPRELTPAFYGCFDWHSAVHGHWLLVRLVRLAPDAPFAAPARAALARSLTPSNIEAEVAYVSRSDRAGFERPYGLAWLLQLSAEVRAWDDPDAKRWSSTLQPLERVAAGRLAAWIPKLSAPIRSGEHSQTAFAFGLALDWARTAGDRELARIIEDAAVRFHGDDRACPLSYEPSGHDFLSPCLAAADLMRRVLPPPRYADWLGRNLPQIPDDGAANWLDPARPTDRTDGKLAHLDGLNLSRAWMLDGIAAGLPPGDPRRAALLAASRRHAEVGLAAVTGEHYAGGHWLASFATYLTTRRGIERSPS